MPALKFKLGSNECIHLYNALQCLAKFSDTVTFEPHLDQLFLTALNPTKSSHARIRFSASKFFSEYKFERRKLRPGYQYAFSVVNKVLLSTFKGKLLEQKGRENGLEFCEVTLVETNELDEYRLIVRMLSGQGITKTYRLTYEAVEPVHALFDKNGATNTWKIDSKLLREYTEYFGAKTEQLDFFSDEARFTLTSYTERVVHGKEVLKKPLQTAVSIETGEFQEFNVTNNMHVAISVRDFRNMVLHAETLSTAVKARFSQPSRPLQFSYETEGMYCEFTLMTVSEARIESPPNKSRTGPRDSASRPASTSAPNKTNHRKGDMGPPLRPAERPLGRQQSGGLSSRLNREETRDEERDEGFFVPTAVGERMWEPADLHTDEDMLGWDANGEQATLHDARFRDTTSNIAKTRLEKTRDQDTEGIAPSQHASQVQSILDDAKPPLQPH